MWKEDRPTAEFWIQKKFSILRRCVRNSNEIFDGDGE